LRIGVTLGDPRGIGAEVVAGAIESGRDDPERGGVEFLLLGPVGLAPASLATFPGVTSDPVGTWTGGGDAEAGRASVMAIERGVELALGGAIDGLVTAPIAKHALAAAGYPWPGHTELLRDRCGVADVTMLMGSESTPLGGPLRIALLTVHVALRDVPALLDEDLVVRRSLIAAAALRDWWGIPRPRLAYAGVNPHASEGGLFGDEEARILEPAMRRVAGHDGLEVVGLHPADTVFRRCIDGRADVVMTPVHDVGLAVLKTLAPESGINVTAGLPFPRTSPDHGTAFDIAGRGIADPRSMGAAIDACVRFCRQNQSTKRQDTRA
jgi:4-hydroxythreonine-4-phosphate dehydrogenase